VAEIVTEEVIQPLGNEWVGMTFPTYRPVLGVLGAAAPGTLASRFRAWRITADGRPAALVIGQLSEDGATLELVSLLVVAALRDRGLATALLALVEADVRPRGVRRLFGTYMTSSPSIPALERVFAKRGFEPPIQRKVAVRFTPEEPAQAPWYQKARLPEGSEIFPWTELSADEDAALKQSQADRPWIPADLEPWRCDQNVDVVSSVGLRKGGEVVGWVINHRMRPDLVAFTVSYMRPDLARRGAIFSLYVESLKRLQGTGVTCTYVTDASFESMARFTLRRVAPYVSFCGETRGISKDLA
jgi:GNAT superfamily N-acetyltransferase